jgi:hypothetical protein
MCYHRGNNLGNSFVLDALLFHQNLLLFDFFCLEKSLLLLKVIGVNRSPKAAFQQFMLLRFHVILRSHSEPKRVMNWIKLALCLAKPTAIHAAECCPE